MMAKEEKRKIHCENSDRWRKANPLKVREMFRKWRKNRRVWFEKIKSGKTCEICGESNIKCLDFHHTDPSIKVSEVSTLFSKHANKNTVLREMEKCMLLCANCHRKIH